MESPRACLSEMEDFIAEEWRNSFRKNEEAELE